VNADESMAWLRANFAVSRETIEKLERMANLTIESNSSQNLISKTTEVDIWNRHIIDSAQLLALVPRAGHWVDLGSGAGFPGIVIAALTDMPVTLIEMRRKRVDHLVAVTAALGLSKQITILPQSVEKVRSFPFSVISARAFAPLERLFSTAHHLSDKNTHWVLPKGRSAASELEAATITWQGQFRMEPSITDPESAIIVARDVQPRRKP